MAQIITEDRNIEVPGNAFERPDSPLHTKLKPLNRNESTGKDQSRFDRTVLLLGAGCIIAGTLARFAGLSTVSDYLLAAGVLACIGIKLGAWWVRK